MGEPIERARQNGAPLVPDNLLWVQEANPEQAVQDFPRKCAGVPNVRYLKAWHQLKRFGPVGTRVSGDRGLSVPLGAVLQIAWLGWRGGLFLARAFESGVRFCPGAVLRPARSRHSESSEMPYGGSVTHQRRLAIAEKPGYRVWA